MIRWSQGVEGVYPDDVVCEVLAAQPSGRPGVTNFESPERDVFVWCDKNRIPRGVLTICQEAPRRALVTGGDFTIMVHPEWRRRKIATKLYRAASDFYVFHLALDPLYTRAGAKWANKMLEQAERELEKTDAS
jgi:hypothetical protein